MKKTILKVLIGLGTLLPHTGKAQADKHIVKKGETLYSISREYGLKVNDLVRVNPVLKSNTNIKPGQQLIIPAGHNHVPASTTPAKVVLTEDPAQTSKVHKKSVSVPSTPETPYRDEDNRKSSASPVNALASNNNENPLIAKPKEVVEPATTFSVRTNSSNPADYMGIFNQYEQHGYKLSHNKGAANYLSDKTSGNPYLSLYSDAEAGSVIKVTNMMNKKSIYVKVLGKVAPVDAGQEIILKLSQQAAQELGAIDEKFLVEVDGVEAN